MVAIRIIELIKLKLLKAIDSDIKPILCIGESKEERESDQTFDVIDKQIITAST